MLTSLGISTFFYRHSMERVPLICSNRAVREDELGVEK